MLHVSDPLKRSSPARPLGTDAAQTPQLRRTSSQDPGKEGETEQKKILKKCITIHQQEQQLCDHTV